MPEASLNHPAPTEPMEESALRGLADETIPASAVIFACDANVQ